MPKTAFESLTDRMEYGPIDPASITRKTQRTILKRLCLAFVLLACSAFSLADDRPTEASVRELINLFGDESAQSNALTDYNQKMMTNIRNEEIVKMAQITKNIDKAIKIVDSGLEKSKQFLDSVVTWKSIEPSVVDLYRDTYSQTEINDLIVFFKSSTGKNFLSKSSITQIGTRKIIQKMIKQAQDDESCTGQCSPEQPVAWM